MAAVTVHSDFGARENKICHCFHFPPFYLPWSGGTGCHDLSFLVITFLSQLFHSPLSPSSRSSLASLQFLPLEWYHLHIWGCWYFSWQSWFQLVIHPTWYLNGIFCVEVKWTRWQYTALTYSILNQSIVPCPVLTIASWPAYRFLRKQIRWFGMSVSFRIFHCLLWSTQSKP